MRSDHDEPFDDLMLNGGSGPAPAGTLLIAGDKHLAQYPVPSAATNSDVARPRSRRAYYPEPCPRRTRANAAAAEQVQ